MSNDYFPNGLEQDVGTELLAKSELGRFLNLLLDGFGTATVDPTIFPRFKDDRISTVAPVVVRMRISVSDVKERYDDFEARTKEYFTNRKFLDEFQEKYEVFLRMLAKSQSIRAKIGSRIPREVKEALIERRLSFEDAYTQSVSNPKEFASLMSTEEIVVATEGALSRVELQSFFRADMVNIYQLFLYLRDKYFIHNVPFVYKKYARSYEDAAARELFLYKKYDEAGLNTLCALTKGGADKASVIIYTLREMDINFLSHAPNIFDSKVGIFRQLMAEIGKLHASFLTHGDLHFNNIGYKVGDDGNIIIFIDLARGSYAGTTIQNHIANDTIPLIGSLLYTLEELIRNGELTDEDRKDAIDAIHKYFDTVIKREYTGLLSVLNESDKRPLTDPEIAHDAVRIFDPVINLLQGKASRPDTVSS